MPKGKATTLTLGLILLWCSQQASAEVYGSGWYRELQVVAGHEDNISRSFYSGDELSDQALTVSIGGGHSENVRGNARFVMFGYISATRQEEFTDLDRLATSAGILYTVQPNPGYGTVWYRSKASATLLHYRDSDEREGLLLHGDVSVNKRLTTSTIGRIGYRYNDLMFVGKSGSEEDNDAAFDTAVHEIYFGLDHQLSSRLSTYAEYAYRDGGVWSNASFKAGLPQYDAETIDRVFDDCSPDDLRCVPRYAGRTTGQIHNLNLGVAFPFRAVNIDLSATYYYVDGDNDETYKNWLFNAGLIWNF